MLRWLSTGGEELACLHWDGGVPVDDDIHQSAEGFDAQ